MKLRAVLIYVTLVAAAAYGAAGDTIRSFSLEGQPSYGVRGLAYNYTNNTVWAAGPNGSDNCLAARFNPTTASVVSSWTLLVGAYWTFDIGYGYRVAGVRYLAVCNRYQPTRMMLFTTTGSRYSVLPDPFSGGYDEGVDCDWGGTYIWATNYSFNTLRRWNRTSWTAWATVPATSPMGVATGWGRVFVVTTSPDYKIYEYNRSSGSIMRTIPLTTWGTKYMVGMSIGRVNASGNEETVFIAVFSPSNMIYEVSVGDVSDTGVAPASLGQVKVLLQ